MLPGGKRELEEVAIEGGWFDQYQKLQGYKYTTSRGFRKQINWKQSAFLIWEALPRDQRHPKTLTELAKVMSYASQSQFHSWRKSDWYKDLKSKLRFNLREEIFSSHLLDIDKMTISEAKKLTGIPGVAARTLFYRQWRDLNDHKNIDDEINRELDRLTSATNNEEGYDNDE